MSDVSTGCISYNKSCFENSLAAGTTEKKKRGNENVLDKVYMEQNSVFYVNNECAQRKTNAK